LLLDHRIERLKIGVEHGDAPDTFVFAELDGNKLVLEVRAPDEQAKAFSDVQFWRDLLLVGYGSAIYVVRLADRTHTLSPAGGYFGSFEVGDNHCLVATDSEIIRLSPQGLVMWRQGGLAADGIIINWVRNGRIEACGQWDPPDAAWTEFVLDLETGGRHGA
jgi:hypothetical protein